MENTNNWSTSKRKFNTEQVIELSNSIKGKMELAQTEAEKEYQQIIKELVEKNDLFEIYKIIINTKAVFLKAKSSDYFILSKYYYNIFSKNEYEKIAKIALTFFITFKENSIYGFNEFKDEFSNEVYEFKKSEILYNACLYIIKIVNKDVSHSIKLPSIENFELESFKMLIENKKENIKIHKKELELNKKYYTNQIDNYVSLLKKESENVNSEKVFDLENKVANYEIENKLLKEQYEHLVDYNLKREPVYIQQFDKTVWGDNYPALKVLYNFLFYHFEIRFNWSFFANMMTVENKEVINLNLKTFTKGETGFFIFKLKEFYLTYINNNYNKWLSEKITINEKVINKSFYDVRVRNTSNDLPNQVNIKLIENLHADIVTSYIKL